MNIQKQLFFYYCIFLICLGLILGCSKLELTGDLSSSRNLVSSDALHKNNDPSSIDPNDDGSEGDVDIDDEETVAKASDEIFKTITTKYNMKNESVVNDTYLATRISKLEISVKESSIDMTDITTSATCYDKTLKKECSKDYSRRLEDKSPVTEGAIYTRVSSSEVKKHINDNVSYKAGLDAFLFVDNVETSATYPDGERKYTYKFSVPIPAVPRSDYDKSKYEKYATKTFEYTYSINDSVYQNIDFKMICTFTTDASNIVTLVITNEITSKLDPIDLNDKNKKADFYGRFPIQKSSVYKINTKTQRTFSISGENELYVDTDLIKTRTSLHMNSKLCSYQVEGSRSNIYSCDF